MKKMTSLCFIPLLLSLTFIIFYQPWVRALPPTPRHASPEQLEKTVRYLTQTVHPRSADNIDNLNRSAEYIKEVFISSGARVTAQDVPITGGPYKNIVADYGPADGPLIIIGAHYDSVSSYENDQLTYTPARMITPAAWQDYSNWRVCYSCRLQGLASNWSPMRRKNRPSFVAMKWGARYMQLRLSVQ